MNDPTTDGISDCTKRYAIWNGYVRCGSRGTFVMTGNHIISEELTISTCTKKWNQWWFSVKSIDSGRWVRTMTALKKPMATSGFRTTRAMGRMNLRSRRASQSHVGTPASSNGAATRLNSRCWSMCALSSQFSLRSWMGVPPAR